MKTSIIILTCHEAERTQNCIDSIRKYLEPDQYEIILLTHAADAAQVLENQPDLKVITTEETLSCYRAYNQAIGAASGDNIFLLENNVIITPNCLSNLIKCLYSHETIGAVRPATNCAANIRDIPLTANQPAPALWVETLKLNSFCLLIKQQVINKIGLFDEQFAPGSFGDEDYSFRIRLAGYKLILCKDTVVHHSGSLLPDNREALQISRDKFIAKWGFDVTYSTFIRYDLISLVDKPADCPLRILEIGCACGNTLLQIKNVYKKAELYGVEYDEKPAAIAASVADVIAADAEKAVLPYPAAFFDYIIFGDVLEHLQNPWHVLKTIKSYLKPDGHILASIPNIMHFSVIRNLILGNWTYENAGLLDKTHLRFFTLSEIGKMFTEAGYTVDAWQPILIHEPESDRLFMQALANLAGNARLAEQYRAYQYLVKASQITGPAGQSSQLNPDWRQLIFLLRKIEQKIDLEQNLQLLINYIEKYQLTAAQICEAIMKNINDSDTIVLTIAIACYNNGLPGYGRAMLEQACKVNPQNTNAVNLLNTLTSLGK